MAMKKYPDIERLGHEDNQEILQYPEDTIVIEEKVDGGNGSFWLEEDGIIHFGSRNRDLTLEGDAKMFEKYQIDLRDLLERNEKNGIKIHPDYIYYIEWMQKHTINYTNAPFVIGLDIRLKRSANSEEPGLFLGRDAKEQEFKRLGIVTTPCIWRGTVAELRKISVKDLIPKSQFFDGMAEGIVIKNYCRKARKGNHQLYAKLVRDEFKEDNKAVFGRVRNKSSDTSKIVSQFCTDARIRKAILKFVNEYGKPLNMTLMSIVPSYIIKDILKEEFSTIYEKYKFIDFKEMRQLVPKLVMPVIQQMMIEKVSS